MSPFERRVIACLLMIIIAIGSLGLELGGNNPLFVSVGNLALSLITILSAILLLVVVITW